MKYMKANSLLQMAQTPLIHTPHKNKTEDAIERSVSDDAFYGQERLEFVKRALKRPLTGSWPRT